MSSAGDLESIVANGLCLGCGLCASLAGGDSIEMAITSFGQIRPQARQALSPEVMSEILKICPGVSLTGPERDPDGETVMHPIWGPIGTLYRGWAADEAIRFRAAAGGMLTALGVHLIRSGKVDAVLHVKASTVDPVLTDAWISTTVAEVIEGAQSRYGPAAPLVHVHRLLAEGKRFAVIGKPCDCSAIRNLAATDPRVRAADPLSADPLLRRRPDHPYGP